MKLLIFGAGASFGCQSEPCPSIAGSLFAELREHYPDTWGSLPTDLSAAHNHDFEAMMATILETFFKGNRAWRLNSQMGEYFLKFNPSDKNLYREILKDLKETSICSLNYDLLLQRAAELEGIRLKPLGFSSPADDGIPLLLPHGSAGLVVQGINISGNTTNGSPFGMMNMLGFRPNMLTCNDSILREYNSNELNPAMSFFMHKKPVLIGQDALEEVKSNYKRLVLEAEKIAIVGMAYRAHDEHIFEPLDQSHAQIMVCARNDGEAYVERYGERVTDLCATWEDGFAELKGFLS